MQCIHIVKVPPAKVDEIYITLEPYHEWLRANKITRFRGGNWNNQKDGVPIGSVFRFAEVEDAMAFKLRWYE